MISLNSHREKSDLSNKRRNGLKKIHNLIKLYNTLKNTKNQDTTYNKI